MTGNFFDEFSSFNIYKFCTAQKNPDVCVPCMLGMNGCSPQDMAKKLLTSRLNYNINS